MSAHQRFTVDTTQSHEAIDITDRVIEALAGARGGLALIHTEHTTVALVIGPADEGMLNDYVRVGRHWLDDLGPFEHIENDNPNGEGHLLSSFGGTRLLLPVDDDGLRLGTWQRILLLEYDGPRPRNIDVELYFGSLPSPSGPATPPSR